MTGLDCNILVQLALADHPANAATLTAVQAETQRGHPLVFPSLVLTEFLHASHSPDDDNQLLEDYVERIVRAQPSA